jgi:hypothetical protein
MHTYHLGHSLVGRDMPAMLAQLAGHSYNSQLGWGASLMNHAQAEVPGFDVENATAAFKPVAEALAAGDVDVFVMTEMVEITDAIKWHNSAKYLAHWAKQARSGNPQVRIYLYETWHRLDDPKGWLARIDTDLAQHWEGQLLQTAMADLEVGTVHVIPGGQVLAATARAIEAGEIAGLNKIEDVFALNPDGTQDTIHFNDYGAYIIALTHYAVIYAKSPIGLPHDLLRADGTVAQALSPQAALRVQELVWQVVTRYAPTGVQKRTE